MVFKRPAAQAVEEVATDAVAASEMAVLKRPAAKMAREGIAKSEAAEPDAAEPEVAEPEAAEKMAIAEEAPAVLKRPAAKEASAEASVESEPAKVEMSEEESLRIKEEETTAARRKELKTTPADDLKQLLGDQGLEIGNKADMVERLVSHEAACRDAARALQAKTRKVLVDKKDALEAMPMQELRDVCSEEGIKGGQLSKQARVEALLKLWLEDDGVNKALAQMERDAREAVLVAMDKQELKKFCETLDIDPLVKEVMVDRIVKCEHRAGRFCRPTLETPIKEAAPSPAQGAVDMVDALLASEAARKKERELQKQLEEAEAQKRADLKSKSVDELKKQLASKGRDTAGKKDDLVEALMQAAVEEDAAAKRKVEIQAMEAGELKKLLKVKALQVSSKKEDMVNAFLAHEAQVRKDAVAYSFKVDAALDEKKAQLESNTLNDLKELCASKDLKGGANKEACLERLLADLRTNGEIDQALALQARAARREELQAMAKEVLLSMCISLELCPFVKEVMVERILAHEAEFGVQEPAIKKARKK